MQRGSFQREMDRLVETFGGQHYKSQRLELIWREVKDFSDTWFQTIVDRLIGECRYAPLLPEFREESSKERERVRACDRSAEAKDGKTFFLGTYLIDEIKTICQYILKRFAGGVLDPDYQNFIKHLIHAAQVMSVKTGPASCKSCEGEGYVLWNSGIPGDYAFRCYCIIGQKKSNGIPVWQPY